VNLDDEEAKLWALRDELKAAMDRHFQLCHRQAEISYSRNPKVLRHAAEVILETAAWGKKVERLRREYHEALDKMVERTPAGDRDFFRRIKNGRPNLSIVVV
jgi:hypothetical protein